MFQPRVEAGDLEGDLAEDRGCLQRPVDHAAAAFTDLSDDLVAREIIFGRDGTEFLLHLRRSSSLQSEAKQTDPAGHIRAERCPTAGACFWGRHVVSLQRLSKAIGLRCYMGNA